MKVVLKAMAILGLVLSALAPVLLVAGILEPGITQAILCAGMVFWFVGAIPWLGAAR